MVFREVQEQFLKWRMGGQYVDKDDLLADFDFRLAQKISELELKRDQDGCLSEQNTKKIAYAERRREAHKKSVKNQQGTVEQMQRLCDLSDRAAQRTRLL